MMMASQLLQPPLSVSSSPSTSNSSSSSAAVSSLSSFRTLTVYDCAQLPSSSLSVRRRRNTTGVVFVGKEELQFRLPSVEFGEDENDGVDEEDDEEEVEPTPEDLEYISEIKRVLELLKKNRDMLYNEVKLTIMIEDPREVERQRLLGIDDSEVPTREDLAEVLDEVNEGKVPRDREALKMLAEEMLRWPNLEVEPVKKPRKTSLYAKVTDTGVDPKEAARRLNVDWDSAADIEDSDVPFETEVPKVLGYGALYLVSAFPIIIGISVVLILFYNSLQ